MKRLFTGAAMFGALFAFATNARAECVNTVGFQVPGAYAMTTQTKKCTDDQTSNEVVLLMTQVRDLQAQNKQLAAVVTALQQLTAANEAFRATFQQAVAEQQKKMRDDVVAQLVELPARVATDVNVIDVLATRIASRLAADESFKQSLKP